MALEVDEFTSAFAELSKLGAESTTVEAGVALDVAAGGAEGAEGAAKPAEGAEGAAKPAEGAEGAAKPAEGAEGAAKPAEGAEGAAKPAEGAEGAAKPAEGVEGAAKPAEGAEGAAKPEGVIEPVAKIEPKAEDESVLKRLADILEDKKPAQVEAPVVQPAQELYTPEEKTFLEKYDADWPDVARAEGLRRRGEYQQLVEYMFKQFADVIAPLQDNIGAMAQRAHLSDLHSSIENYDAIRDQVITWVNSQPAYLQPSYQHVIKNGTAEEIKDLVGRWKQSTGVGVTPTLTPAKKADTELPKDAKQAAASLAPVSAKRSQVAAASEPEDFDGAFAAAAAAADKV